MDACGALLGGGVGGDVYEAVDEDGEADGEQGPADDEDVGEAEDRHAGVEQAVLGAGREGLAPGLACG